jgi:hypothetical protein
LKPERKTYTRKGRLEILGSYTASAMGVIRLGLCRSLSEKIATIAELFWKNG